MLGFYLASWGMYRGSSKLLTDYTYTIHKGAIKTLKKCKDLKVCCKKLHDYYENQVPKIGATDTLISKIILGTRGELPAFDDYFCKGIKHFKENVLLETEKNTFSKGKDLAEKYESIQKALKNNPTSPNLNEFEQIAKEEKLPVAKIIDMYFWELGRRYESDMTGTENTSEVEETK